MPVMLRWLHRWGRNNSNSISTHPVTELNIIPMQTSPYREEIERLYTTTNLRIRDIAKLLGCSKKTVDKWVKHLSRSSSFVPNLPIRKPRPPRTNFWVNDKGYVWVTKPDWYDAQARATALHRVIYCWYNNLTKVPSGCNIHHIDGNKLNNHIDNLKLVTIQEHHALHH